MNNANPFIETTPIKGTKVFYTKYPVIYGFIPNNCGIFYRLGDYIQITRLFGWCIISFEYDLIKDVYDHYTVANMIDLCEDFVIFSRYCINFRQLINKDIKFDHYNI